MQHFLHGGERNFYPRPPRGGRPAILVLCGGRQVFLSTPSARRATRYPGQSCDPFVFLSTPSARRATAAAGGSRSNGRISIHALREEGDPPIPTQ